MMSDDYTLQQLLRREIDNSQQNCIAFCLAKSRRQQPTHTSIQLNLEIIHNSNDVRWIEVLQRQAINNYRLVFHLCKNIVLVYPTLFEINNPIDNQLQFAHLQNNVINIITQSNQQQIANQIKWNAFTALLKVYLQKTISLTNLQKFMTNLNSLFSNQNIETDFQTWKQLQLSSDQFVDNSIYCVTAFELILIVVKLYKKICGDLRSKMRYLHFIANNKSIIYWLSRNYMDIFSLSSSLIKAPFEKHYHKTSIKFKLQEDLIKCLIQLKQFPQIQNLIIASHPILVQTLMNNNLIVIDNKSILDIEDQLNWQYSLIDGHFGQDLPSFITKLTLSLSQCPGFLTYYIKNLQFAYQTNLLSQNQAIIKLSIIYKPLSKRKDLTYSLVQPLINIFVRNFTLYNNSIESQMNFCRKLRLLFLFFQFLKQSQINKLMQFIFNMLKNEQYTSFCFKQAYLLMQRFQSIEIKQNYKNKHVSSIVRAIKQQSSTIMTELVNIVHHSYAQQSLSKYSLERQGKLIQIYKLIELILNSNQKELQNLFPNLTINFSDWICAQFEAHWNRGVKSSLILDYLIRIAKKMIQSIKQDYYIDLTQSIYKILKFINYPQASIYEQELLQILIFVLDSQKLINQATCTILLSLKKITQNHQYNIFPIRYVLKILCGQKISQSILYQWSDLCIFLLNLFLEYFSRYTHSDYTSLYKEEWIQMINIFGLFVQIYDEIIDKNENIRYEILSLVDKFTDQQVRLQILIIVNFKRNIKINPLCNATNIITYLKQRKTFKLIILYYCNMISYRYDELIMNQLIQCHRIFKQKKIKMDFPAEMNFMQWPYLSGKIQTRTLEVVRRARRQGHIDDFQFNQIVKQLNFN